MSPFMTGVLPDRQCTFPRRIEDTPAYHNFPGENLKVLYGEGLYIGYKHYDRTQVAPLFPFGHGLSYTTFEYGHPEISTRVLTQTTPVVLTLAVTNIGTRPGMETVQIYIHDPRSRLPRPEKALAAFEKVSLSPGETRHVHITLDKHAVGYYDETIPGWIAEEGTFEVWVGSSSADIRRRTSFTVQESFSWIF